MGCWGFGINQSDEALDWESALYDAAGVKSDMMRFNPASKTNCEKMEKSLPALFSLIESEREIDPYSMYCAVGYQMLVSMLMAAGAKFTDEDRVRLEKGAICCAEYALAKEALRLSGGRFITAKALEEVGYKELSPVAIDAKIGRLQGRASAIDELVSALHEYDLTAGIPVNVDAPGLIETFKAHKHRAMH